MSEKESERAPVRVEDEHVGAVSLDPARAFAAAEAERDLAQADKRMMALMKARHMLFAHLRAQGRIRISRSDLERVSDRDKIDVKVQENGDLVVSYVEGE